MKLLALDWGLKRTGIAVTDAGGRMAFPRAVVRMTTREAFFGELLALIEAENPGGIVVGLPLSLEGAETPTTRQVKNFTMRLMRRTALPVWHMPETLSSCAAQSLLAEAGVSARRQKDILDAQAAVLILESFLNLPEQKRQRA